MRITNSILYIEIIIITYIYKQKKTKFFVALVNTPRKSNIKGK